MLICGTVALYLCGGAARAGMASANGPASRLKTRQAQGLDSQGMSMLSGVFVSVHCHVYVCRTDGGPRPSAAASVGPQSLLDAAFVDDSTACGSLLLVDVRVSAAGAGASGSSGVSLVPQHRPCGLSPVLDVVLWSASAAAGTPVGPPHRSV